MYSNRPDNPAIEHRCAQCCATACGAACGLLCGGIGQGVRAASTGSASTADACVRWLSDLTDMLATCFVNTRTVFSTPSRKIALVVLSLMWLAFDIAMLASNAKFAEGRCAEPLAMWQLVEGVSGIVALVLATCGASCGALLGVGNAASGFRGLGAFMGGLGVLGTAFKLVWFVLGVVWLAGTDTSSCPAAGGALWALTCAFVATNCAALLLGLLVWLALQPMHDQRSFLPLHAAAPGSAAAAPVGTATPPGQLQMKARAGFAPDAVAARWHQRWQAQTTAAQASPTAFARSTALALAGLLPVYCLAAAQVLCLFRGVCAAPHSPTVAPAASMAVVPVLALVSVVVAPLLYLSVHRQGSKALAGALLLAVAAAISVFVLAMVAFANSTDENASARVREVLSGMRAAERRVAGAEGELISQFGDNMRLIGALATGLSGLLALVTGAGGVLLCRLAVWRG